VRRLSRGLLCIQRGDFEVGCAYRGDERRPDKERASVVPFGSLTALIEFERRIEREK
jgi:hypothetical protein